jgi:ribosomal protein S18 acetylase RimI-like enzyme
MVEVRIADLQNRADQESIVALLDMYCRDEFGDGFPLSDEARTNLIPGLQGHAGSRVFLAAEAGRDIGLAICFVGFSSFRGKRLLNIHDIAVDPKARGRGVGRALLAAIDAEARALDCCRITLEVRSDNLLAQRTYLKDGFQPSDPQSWFWTKKL